MKRRAFMSLLAVAWPLAARAQQSIPVKRPLIGFLGTSAKAVGARVNEIGYLAGRDYDFEDRYAQSDLARLPALAEELLQLKPDVLVVTPCCRPGDEECDIKHSHRCSRSYRPRRFWPHNQ
jgi:putative ABC transport system substrate-binding protein